MSAGGGNGLVIVGGGLASARLVKAYRERGGDGPVTLYSADSSLPYHRPPLSKRYLRGEIDADRTLVENDAFYREHGVDVRLETFVRALRADEHTIEVDGEDVRYKRLVIASGASPRRLNVPGEDLEGVFTLRTLEDSRRIHEATRGARHAVVVGAGFIGMEVAASLSQLGLEVTLVHRGKGLFEILRAHSLMVFLEDLYRRKGVEPIFSDHIVEFGGRGRIDSVTTKLDRVYQAELAVVGIGVAPTTAWLEGSGVELDNGVVVNERFETNAPDVYAVGDVARFYDPIFERHRRIEHWSNANYQGTKLGELLAGGGGGYDIVSTFFSEVFGVTIKVFGDVDDYDELVTRGSFAGGTAIVFYLRERQLVACLLVGQDEETENRLKVWIAARARVSEPDRLADRSTELDDAFEVAAGA
jgi:NADPH-dependent 2,4-dienoyl-CoA reductase/sulfur reductase-like enzyme